MSVNKTSLGMIGDHSALIMRRSWSLLRLVAVSRLSGGGGGGGFDIESPTVRQKK